MLLPTVMAGNFSFQRYQETLDSQLLMRDTKGSCDNFTSSCATHTSAKKKERKKNSENRKPLKRDLETEKDVVVQPFTGEEVRSVEGLSFLGVRPISSEYMGSMYWAWYIFFSFGSGGLKGGMVNLGSNQ